MKHELVVTLLRFCTILLLLVAIGACLPSRAFAATGAEPCATNPESRQLDYWLGNWSMGNAAAAGSSTSKVSLSLDKCMFVEHWENGKGHVTQKMFAYSPEDKNWYGMFADNDGRVHVFLDGKVSLGAAEFHGPSRGPNGEVVLNRLKVVRVSVNKLEETWDKSTDNGANWTTAYRAEYSRVNP
jgi:hypothetical protein